MFSQMRQTIGSLGRETQKLAKRNIGVTAPALQASDPIQKLFVDKLREYTQKSKAAGGKLVDATPEAQKDMSDELTKIERQYGGGSGVDLTKFPTFTFKDPSMDALTAEKK